MRLRTILNTEGIAPRASTLREWADVVWHHPAVARDCIASVLSAGNAP